MADPVTGARVIGRDGRAVGRVEAVFADYLLVRSGRLLPVDLYVPRPAVTAGSNGGLHVDATRREAYQRWHRPLRQAPHP